jgi:hypothetical protein
MTLSTQVGRRVVLALLCVGLVGFPGSAALAKDSKPREKVMPTTLWNQYPLDPSTGSSRPQGSTPPKRQRGYAPVVSPRPPGSERPAESNSGSEGGILRTLAIGLALFGGVILLGAVVRLVFGRWSRRRDARRERVLGGRQQSRRVRVRRRHPEVALALVARVPEDRKGDETTTAPAGSRRPAVEPERPSLEETLAPSGSAVRRREVDEVGDAERASRVSAVAEKRQPPAVEARAETCTIALSRNDGDCDFYARVERPRDDDDVAARSPMFRWPGDDSPPKQGAILAAHNVLVQRLEWDGWNGEDGGGRRWWERRFRRAAAPEARRALKTSSSRRTG